MGPGSTRRGRLAFCSSPPRGLLLCLEDVARLRCTGRDPAHDLLHVLRVADTGRTLALAEGADVTIVVAAALLHELFSYPKGDPESPRSGEVCAEQAAAVLVELSAPDALVAPVSYAIRVHPFSLGIVPETPEAKILQDADRLDAIGAIGIARLFASCQAMGRPFYAEEDPFCTGREPDDRLFGLDHFCTKLLRIPERLHTAAARSLAEERAVVMRAFLWQLGRELGRPF